jgi:hypothetical protein
MPFRITARGGRRLLCCRTAFPQVKLPSFEGLRIPWFPAPLSRSEAGVRLCCSSWPPVQRPVGRRPSAGITSSSSLRAPPAPRPVRPSTGNSRKHHAPARTAPAHRNVARHRSRRSRRPLRTGRKPHPRPSSPRQMTAQRRALPSSLPSTRCAGPPRSSIPHAPANPARLRRALLSVTSHSGCASGCRAASLRDSIPDVLRGVAARRRSLVRRAVSLREHPLRSVRVTRWPDVIASINADCPARGATLRAVYL